MPVTSGREHSIQRHEDSRSIHWAQSWLSSKDLSHQIGVLPLVCAACNHFFVPNLPMWNKNLKYIDTQFKRAARHVMWRVQYYMSFTFTHGCTIRTDYMIIWILSWRFALSKVGPFCLHAPMSNSHRNERGPASHAVSSYPDRISNRAWMQSNRLLAYQSTALSVMWSKQRERWRRTAGLR